MINIQPTKSEAVPRYQAVCHMYLFRLPPVTGYGISDDVADLLLSVCLGSYNFTMPLPLRNRGAEYIYMWPIPHM